MSAIGEEFDLEIFTRRWGHTEIYHLKLTTDGWDFRGVGSYDGKCDPEGKPCLYEEFNHESANVSASFGMYLRHLHEEAVAGGLSSEDIQDAFKQLSDWQIKTEKNAPSTGVWEHY
ncbi:MAG: hypothetical protein H6685_02165 [Deltaproteobacteria bacterium]|nr:hypothetical protein [Deltaproteobacteria bacterium]